MSLNVVYQLEADSSYNVVKPFDKKRTGYVLIRTTKGNGIMHLINLSEPLRASSNTLLVVATNTVRHYYCEKDVWDFWWFEFDVTGPLPFSLNTVIDIISIENETETCKKCLTLLRFNTPYSNVLASSTLNTLMYEWLYQSKAQMFDLVPHYHTINDVIQYLYKNLSINISVKEMAKMANLSERQFRSVFKSITGNAPKQFYEKLKLNIAIEYLTKTTYSISEISDKLGYSNQLYFTKVFKQYYSMPPSKYRNIK